ncbi:odorant receptor 94a-like [Bradysia coprophila]|uniref:odorant receptor 94a-like n=1 Tax=Bradysia coprophila TaxID=38358 RepID=UPI00187DBA9E|nr:odorant receptor 94a-like [Bradysia coprophila]
MGLLNRICVLTIRNDESFTLFSEKVEKLIKFIVIFSYATAGAISGNSIFPFIGKQKRIIVDIAFPLDWKNSEIGFWLTYVFFLTENMLSFLTIVYASALIWYLLLHCSLRYRILGTEIRNMGRISDDDDIQMYSLIYCIAELFMITYFGNEIMLSSGELTYNLFESNWVEQSHATKKCIIIFGEYLKQSHEMLIGKLYPLTLESFVRILNSSYTLFNVLQNFKP